MEEVKNETKQTKTQVFNVVILDKSGSMESIRKAAIDGFNETLAGIKQLTPIINAEGRVEQVTVEMGTTLGNPHEVFFVDAPDALDPQFKQLCTDACYAELRKRANIECVYVLNRKELCMRVCERGTGETMACGTGACAAAVEAMNKKLTTNKVTVHMPGGDVSVRRDDKGIIYLTGTATEVFRGEYNWED